MSLSQTFNQDVQGDIGTSALATTAGPTYSDQTQNPLSLDLAGNLRVNGSAVTQPISAATLPLPTGASTSALQTSGNSTLTTISGQLPTTLGAKTIANSLAVNVASDQVVPISATALPLPTGAATSALQTTGNTSLSTIATNTTSITGQLPTTLGQKTSVNSLAVVLASDETIPISAPVSATATQTSVSSSATTVTLLASNASRKSFSIFNDSTKVLYISFAATANTSAYGVKLFSDGLYENGEVVYTGVISGIWASANGSAKIVEYN